jgi:hypothetical protein
MDDWLQITVAAIGAIIGCIWLWQGYWWEGGAALIVALLLALGEEEDN